MANKHLTVNATNDAEPIAPGSDNEVIDKVPQPQFYPASQSGPIDIPVALRFKEDSVNALNKVNLESNYSTNTLPVLSASGNPETSESVQQWYSERANAPVKGSSPHYSENASPNGCRHVSSTSSVFQPRNFVDEQTKDVVIEIKDQKKLTNDAGAPANEVEDLSEINTSSGSIEVLHEREMTDFVSDENSPLLGNLPHPVQENSEPGRPTDVQWRGQDAYKNMQVAIVFAILAMLWLMVMVLSVDGTLPRVCFELSKGFFPILATASIIATCYA